MKKRPRWGKLRLPQAEVDAIKPEELSQQATPEENLEAPEAWIRVAGGLILLALSARGAFGRIGSLVGLVVGAGAVADGVTRYCPVYDWLGLGRSEARRAGHTVDRRAVERTVRSVEPVARTFPWDEKAPDRVEENERTAAAAVQARPAEGRPAVTRWRGETPQ